MSDINKISIYGFGREAELCVNDRIVFLGNNEDVEELNCEGDPYLPKFGEEYDVLAICADVYIGVKTDMGKAYWIPASKCIVERGAQIKRYLK